MQPALAPDQLQSNQTAIPSGYTPFSIQRNLDKLSASSTMLSDGLQGAASSSSTCPHGLCSYGSLSTWSSLQLQEQHLLGGGNSNACSTSNCSTACTGQVSRAAQDMVVLVLPRGEKDTAAAAGNGAGTGKQKPRTSQGGSNLRVSSAGSMQSVRQVGIALESHNSSNSSSSALQQQLGKCQAMRGVNTGLKFRHCVSV